MNEQEYLVKAQEAEVVSNAAQRPGERRRWVEIAAEYRRPVETVRLMRLG